jgi:hypothetical protein
MAIWVIKEGQREGPYDEDDVRELIYEGTYSDNDPAIRDGQYDWSTIGNVLDPRPGDLPPVFEGEPDFDLPEATEAPDLPIAAEEAAEPEPILLPPPPSAPPPPMRVTLSDIEMPFGSMVVFLLKWAAASLVVLLIVGFVMGVLWLILAVMAAAILR